jgi:hypothetical protein
MGAEVIHAIENPLPSKQRSTSGVRRQTLRGGLLPAGSNQTAGGPFDAADAQAV